MKYTGSEIIFGLHGNEDLGPTEITGYWNGMDPPNGGYTIYTKTARQYDEPSIVIAHNDSEAIYFAKAYGGTNINTINDALSYLLTGSSQTTIVNSNFKSDIVTNGLILYFDAGILQSYPRYGGNWKDLSGNGYGSNINIATFDSATNSFNFPANNANYMASTYSGQPTDFTLEVWFKDDGSARTHERLVDKNYVSGFWLGRNASTANQWGGGIMETISPYGIFLTLTDTQWHFITSIRSGTTHTLYGDGIANTTSNTVTGNALDSTALTIGNWYDKNNAQSFGGNIAIVKFYNRALSSSEVLQNYNAIKSRFGL